MSEWTDALADLDAAVTTTFAPVANVTVTTPDGAAVNVVRGIVDGPTSSVGFDGAIRNATPSVTISVATADCAAWSLGYRVIITGHDGEYGLVAREAADEGRVVWRAESKRRLGASPTKGA